ncbi:hypothetical protein SteCoe_25820 [Stentor coeruleus]|uniref:LITAF domain-containing protein n=1 Tax=Stentor coeruleus TaxID=5963 RepID=A0A1R2BEA8_9CILI|nr:hypothetical protein SteCoe_25820 [Stentor coeruleus]
MAFNQSDMYLNSSMTPQTSNHTKYFQPEYSEEPQFSSLHTTDTRFGLEKSDCLQGDTRHSIDLNSSSLQSSTLQSINLKRSFYFTSPKRSIPQASLTLPLKTKELNDQSQSPKLEKNLLKLEKHSEILSKSEKFNSNSFFDLDHGKYNSIIKVPDGNISYEGNDDIKIPQLMWCASCGAEVMTKIEYVNTDKTFWAAMGILFSGGCLGCFLLPYMTNTCKNARVRCHKCDRILR